MERELKRVAKKLQKSIYFDPELFETIYQRSLISHRTISGQIEHMLRKQLQSELKSDALAISMAEQGKKNQAE